MAKFCIWYDEYDFRHEAHSEEDAHLRAASMGLRCTRVEDNPEYTLSDAIDDLAPEIVSQSAGDREQIALEDKDVLARANAVLFNQLDALKNKCQDLETAIAAWNTEQHTLNKEYAEPVFVELSRRLLA